MILGIGTDIVEVERMQKRVERWGDQAGRHILAPDELAEFLASADRARFLAKRFAVKEALAKALGTGLRAPVLCPNIAVIHDELGRPMLWLAPVLADYAASRGITHHHLSISDERRYALAFVVLEGNTP